MPKKAQITISYVVYSKDYVPGVGSYIKFSRLQKAKAYAKELGHGVEIWQKMLKTRRDGSSVYKFTDKVWVVN